MRPIQSREIFRKDKEPGRRCKTCDLRRLCRAQILRTFGDCADRDLLIWESASAPSALRPTAFARCSARVGAGKRRGLPAVARPKDERRLVALTGASWNQVVSWLHEIDGLRRAV